MKKIRITDNLLAYEENLFEEEKSDNTIKKYVRDIKKFINYIEDETEISKSTTIKFKEFIQGEYKTSSANSIFVALNKYLHYLGEENLKIKLIKTQKNIFAEESRFLTRQEYIQLIETAKNTKKEKDIIRLADILGHSSIETTRIYTKITISEYQRGISELNLVYG